MVESAVGSGLLSGMWVLVPHRTAIDVPVDYYLGQIQTVNEGSRRADVRVHVIADKSRIEKVELWNLHRCRILTGTRCFNAADGAECTVLFPVSLEWKDGDLLSYYVDVEGETRCVNEADLWDVPFTRCDIDPLMQLVNCEFHDPEWRPLRDRVIRNVCHLDNATFGIQDLVGSRIRLLFHQASVVATVLGNQRCRFVLADEVGLGKTVEASIILLALRRRHPHLHTLIIAPASLAQQWQNELDNKFWLRFPVVSQAVDLPRVENAGVIVVAENLASDADLWGEIGRMTWDLLVADEAHHISKDPELTKRVRELSAKTERVLLLSATPIQRRASEYLGLLTLMDPERYGRVSLDKFQQMLDAQQQLRNTVGYLASDLEEFFDPKEFTSELEELVEQLGHDTVFRDLLGRVEDGEGVAAAREVLAYLSENYRVESRVVRNRRKYLLDDSLLPTRAVDTSYRYTPSTEEREALDALCDYLEAYIAAAGTNPIGLEFCRTLLHAAASSPHALERILNTRQIRLRNGRFGLSAPDLDLTRPAAPRREPQRVAALAQHAPCIEGEAACLEVALRVTREWKVRCNAAVNAASKSLDSDRLVRVLQAVFTLLKMQPKSKVIVFSSWQASLAAIRPQLEELFPKGTIAQFHAGISDPVKLQEAATRFQKDPKCRVLLCDELGGEGRNFQMASYVIHLDLPWSPGQIEQRIGRVDRLGREGVVTSIVPCSCEGHEAHLFTIWQEAYHLFTESLSGLEIALEGVQDRLVNSLRSSIRHGIEGQISELVREARALRDEVLREQEFDGAMQKGDHVQKRKREFERISGEYALGVEFGRDFVSWARKAGLCIHQDPQVPDLYITVPTQSDHVAMRAAKLYALPSMEDAIQRAAWAPHDSNIKGTFNRDLAALREELIFFAPGSDEWTDAIVGNMVEAARGRCTAILRQLRGSDTTRYYLDLTYTLGLDPRPLYGGGFSRRELFRALGFLDLSSERIILGLDGEVVHDDDAVWYVLKPPFQGQWDQYFSPGTTHEAFTEFRNEYPKDEWSEVTARIEEAARRELNRRMWAVQSAEAAREEFARRAEGWRAASQWLSGSAQDPVVAAELDAYEAVSAALVEGIAAPIWRLESVCLWALHG